MKSERAKEMLSTWRLENGGILKATAVRAIELAEEDAEKRLLSLFKKELYEDGLMKNSPWIAERIFQRVVVEINKG